MNVSPSGRGPMGVSVILVSAVAGEWEVSLGVESRLGVASASARMTLSAGGYVAAGEDAHL